MAREGKVLTQFYLDKDLRRWFQAWCKHRSISGGMSGALNMLIKGIKASEIHGIHPSSEIDVMKWATERCKPYMSPPDGNGGNGRRRKLFQLFS